MIIPLRGRSDYENIQEGWSRRGRPCPSTIVYRYRVEPQAFKRDILRQRGPHYSWVKHQWLNVGGLDELSFDCGVEDWRPALKNLFAEAKRKPSDANIQAIAEKLESYGSMATTGTNNSPCVLRRAYATYPKNFKRALLKQQGPVYEWLMKRFVSVKGNEGKAFACQLRQRREALANEWQRLWPTRKRSDVPLSVYRA